MARRQCRRSETTGHGRTAEALGYLVLIEGRIPLQVNERRVSHATPMVEREWSSDHVGRAPDAGDSLLYTSRRPDRRAQYLAGEHRHSLEGSWEPIRLDARKHVWLLCISFGVRRPARGSAGVFPVDGCG